MAASSFSWSARSGFTQNSILYNSAFLRLNDFEKVKVRPNTDNIGANLAAKIDVVTTSSTNLTFGGSFNYNKNKRYNYNQSLFASDEYPEQTSLDWRAYARFTQRFKNAEVEEGASSSLIKNAFYTIQADISQGYDRRWNPDHEDRPRSRKRLSLRTFPQIEKGTYFHPPDTLQNVPQL